jgi:hypothetical protein
MMLINKTLDDLVGKKMQLMAISLNIPTNFFYLPKYFVKKIFSLLLHPMKIVPMRFLILLAMLFPLAECFAAPNDPPPPTPPPPPGLPLDNGIVVLLCVAIMYGLYKVYKFRIKKTPV